MTYLEVCHCVPKSLVRNDIYPLEIAKFKGRFSVCYYFLYGNNAKVLYLLGAIYIFTNYATFVKSVFSIFSLYDSKVNILVLNEKDFKHSLPE